MNRRGLDLDPDSWPAFDVRALPRPQQRVFKARRTAVELFAAGTALSEIKSRSGVHRRQIYRLLERCQAIHEDGRIFGWRGLVPQARVRGYERTAGVALSPGGRTGGSAGAFGQLLRAHPSLAKWLTDSLHHKRIAIDQLSTDIGLRVRLRGLKHLHNDFLRQCRSWAWALLITRSMSSRWASVPFRPLFVASACAASAAEPVWPARPI